MRYYAFTLWVAVTFYLSLWFISDFAFGDGSAKKLIKRLLFAIIWPFALLSRPGRNVMFKSGKGL